MLKQIATSALATALVLTAVSVAASARAQTPDLPAVTVSFAGLDTTSTSGAKVMLQRIQAAAAEVCGGVPSQPLDRLQTFKPCVREVTLRTVAGLHNARLTAELSPPSLANRIAMAR